MEQYLNQSGMFDVGDGHRIYYEDWGNPQAATPIFYLHGGPGAGNKDKNKLFFDPLKQRVIFHDQRGAGKSTPFASTSHNTTQDLASDINKLADNLKIEKFALTGGSWGSALALYYAITNPQRVTKLLLYGILLGRHEDITFVNQGAGRSHFPDAWERYISLVPPKYHGNTTAYFAKQFESDDEATSQKYVREWVLFESSLMNFEGQLDRAALDAEEYDDTVLALAKLEAHYFLHDFFLEPNFVLNNIKAVEHIPAVFVHGRYDFVCPPIAAYELAKAYGPNATLRLVQGGHSRSDIVILELIKTYTQTFLA